MKVKVLKSFPYYADGVTPQVLAEGDVVELPEDLSAGLIAEAFVANVEVDPPEEVVTEADPPEEATAKVKPPKRGG